MRTTLIRYLLALWVCLAIFPCLRANAEGMDVLENAASDLELPAEAAAVLETQGIRAEEPSSVLQVPPTAWLQAAWDTLRTEIKAPAALLSSLLTLTLLAAAFEGMSDTASCGGMRGLFDTLCTLICVGAAASPLCDCLNRTARTLTAGDVFMGGFVPVFSGFLAAGGAVASGTTYHAVLLMLTEFVEQLTSLLLFPLMKAAAALGAADAVNPHLRLGGLVKGIRRVVTWSLATLMAFFAAILSVRSFVADAADGLASKTVRLLTSGLIPIVGGAVSDAYGTVQGSIRLLQNGTGVLGILAIVWLLLPPLLSAICYRAAFHIAGIAAELAGADSMRRLCADADEVLSAAFAMLVTYGIMLIFSTAILLLLMGT